MSGKYQVLVVGGDRQNRARQGLVLDDQGYSSIGAESVTQAYGILFRKKPDLIIIGINPKGGGGVSCGLKLMRAVRNSNYSRVPILVISGSGGMPDEAKDLADFCLTKPYDLQKYEETVRYLLTKDSMYNTFSKLWRRGGAFGSVA